jgi:predicted metal-dependent phosphoesterase TrpH
MTASPRSIAAVVMFAGIVVGTVSDRFPDEQPRRAGDYWILAGDFHVHAFPGDGALAPWALRDEARRAGLDVYAVTNHKQVFTARLARWVSRFSDGPIVIPGEEITNPDYHLIAVGVEHSVGADQPAAAAIAAVHAQGGVAIAAHPGRTFRGYDDDEAVAALDGTELAHPAMHEDETFRQDIADFFERARRLKPNMAAIGSSDFHASPALARCRTLVFTQDRTAAAVIEAIRGGRTVAVDGDGRLYGDPALVALAQEAPMSTRSDANSWWRRLSMMLTWAGVLGLLLLRGTARG